MAERAFIQGIINRAKQAPRRVCLSESESIDVLRLAERIVEEGIGTPVLVGNPAAVTGLAGANGISADGFEFFDNSSDEVVASFSQEWLARSDQFSPKALARRIKDPLLCSMLLLKAGKVDCVASGKECPTGDVIAAAMSIVGLAKGVTSPSSLGIADIPGFDGPQGSMLGLADCAITAQPDAEQLAGIAIASADTARQLLNWEPRVALLAFSTCGSANHPSVTTVQEAVQRVHELRPDIKCDGEFQFDAAIIPTVAAHKVKRASEVAGKANVLIFPNLHAGNIGVKMVQIFGHANAYGPVLQGFAKPVCDFSRSAPVEEMLGNVAMLVIRAGEME
ncbi:phosphate acetyltransferase [Olsenella sp. AF16-14LB]|uniref:phosphate acyltransferase n=1 Tax=unclassified Olsenella TaxID=2638792 RepID=UPI000E54B54A|nr:MULTISPECIES: phosphate acyltransferase [unclassified Olsenella]RGU52537.1 phosphate acetyltransferase [Olsenella sp. AF16-14LB]RGU83779.1 phosphate acetyltransferase [Olsenella sp. AF15-43LB]